MLKINTSFKRYWRPSQEYWHFQFGACLMTVLTFHTQRNSNLEVFCLEFLFYITPSEKLLCVHQVDVGRTHVVAGCLPYLKT